MSVPLFEPERSSTVQAGLMEGSVNDRGKGRV